MLYPHDIPMIFPFYPQSHSINSHSENWSRSATAPPPLAQVPDPHAVVVAGSGKHRATWVEIHRHDLEEFHGGFPNGWDPYSRYSLVNSPKTMEITTRIAGKSTISMGIWKISHASLLEGIYNDV